MTPERLQEIERALRTAFPESGLQLTVVTSNVSVSDKLLAATVLIRQDLPAEQIPLDQRNAASLFYGNARTWIEELLTENARLREALSEITKDLPRYVRGQSEGVYASNLANHLLEGRNKAIAALKALEDKSE